METNKRLSVLISSCDKFSDLWDENVRLYRKNWQENTCRTVLVTDAKRDWQSDRTELICVDGENSFPQRIKHALESITTPYVLVTLDDYFLIDPVDREKIEYLLDRMEQENIQYLSLYNRRVTCAEKYLPLQTLLPIDLQKKYAVTLYPAIWEVAFLKETICEDLSPWLYEVSLTQTAIKANANCKASLAGLFNIQDVVRKGKVLHKAQRYFKRHGIRIGTRPTISYWTECKLWILDMISWYTPRKLFKAGKKIAKKLGFKFFSED